MMRSFYPAAICDRIPNGCLFVPPGPKWSESLKPRGLPNDRRKAQRHHVNPLIMPKLLPLSQHKATDDGFSSFFNATSIDTFWGANARMRKWFLWKNRPWFTRWIVCGQKFQVLAGKKFSHDHLRQQQRLRPQRAAVGLSVLGRSCSPSPPTKRWEAKAEWVRKRDFFSNSS